MSNVVKAHPPLAFLSSLGPLLAAVMAWLVDNHHLTSNESAFITTVVVAFAGLVSAFLVRHLTVGLLTAFATTLMTGLATFSVTVPPDVIAIAVAAITFIGGYFLHTNTSPRLVAAPVDG